MNEAAGRDEAAHERGRPRSGDLERGLAVLLGGSEDAGGDEHAVEGLGARAEERAEVGDRCPEAARVEVLLGSERRAPQERADVLEGRAVSRQLEREAAAVERTLARDRADPCLEHGLTPAERARRDGAVPSASLAARAQAVDVLAVVDACALARTGGAADEAAARVGVERLALHAEELRRLLGGHPFATLIDDLGTLIHESMMPA